MILFHSILVVCVGNICRSPVGERLLQARLAARGRALEVASAGIGALVGHPADETAARVAAAHGVDLSGHRGRQFTAELGAAHDLILVMEPWHRREIASLAPALAGRTMLFDEWTGKSGIPDPYRKPEAIHEATFRLLDEAASAWAERLAK
ncbi:protein-tyrosine phosphatase [Meinhardsimonia xiamenensis]|uniref:protein-tyrosine-phosphatase n=1 Tax=Meinhardsimonia xiamenensis TaxID=990712 RepID=A0A1G9HDF7_9RHOB|nr:protein-tyrosine phosphatase [Meinhardsimonia xiamenensis]SDL11061.1 protein-tyrosine phosphatase [Meinhardsimonia xiamenensis]